MDDEIKSVDELRKAQAAAQIQGTSITNYSQWEQILEDLDTAGVESTGSYEGDVRRHQEIIDNMEQMIEQIQEEQKQEQIQPQNDENSKIDEKTSQDREQVLKANVANSTSSVIMADYMKYYHTL